VAGPENVESCVKVGLPCLSLYYFYLTISFWMNMKAKRGVMRK
jgi:hypothetical protein